MEIKTSELIDIPLHYAVAKCLYMDVELIGIEDDDDPAKFWHNASNQHYQFSTRWAQAGPIIEREGIYPMPNIAKDLLHPEWDFLAKRNHYDDMERPMYGPTQLIAVTRCFVALKLGDVVDVPDELIHNRAERPKMR